MSGRLQQLRMVDTVLTKLAQGYENDQFIGSKLLKPVPVATEAFQIPAFGKDSFKVEDSLRAISARRKRIDTPTPSLIDVILEEHSLEAVIDDREKEESFYDLAREDQVLLQDKLGLEREAAQAALVFDAGTYPTGSKTTLSGNSRWDVEHDDSTPVQDLDTGAEAVRGKIGRYPNTLAIGAKGWAALRRHPALRELLGASELKVITDEHLKSLFPWLKAVEIGSAVRLNGAVVADVWGGHAALLYVPENPGRKVPAFGYTFTKKGRPRTTKYRAETNNGTAIVVEEIYRAKVLGSSAGYFIKDIIS